MNDCKNCKHFKADEFDTLPWKDRTGDCSEIQYRIDIDASDGGLGNGAVVNGVEVPALFGCKAFENKA